MENQNTDIFSLVNSYAHDIKENNLDQFKAILRQAVFEMLKSTNIQKILQAFYRIDLSDQDVHSALQLPDIQRKTDKITQLILDRMIKKIKTRETF